MRDEPRDRGRTARDASGPTADADEATTRVDVDDPDALAELSDEFEALLGRGGRVNADPEDVERGLARLVLTLVDFLRQLMERQAVRRMEGGELTDEEIERLGQTFMALERRMGELRDTFGLTEDDLDVDLGPLGRLK